MKNSLQWCEEKTIEVEIILLLFRRSLNWNRCPINGCKCLMHTKFDFKLGNFFFHFFFNFGKVEIFRAKILRDDWQTSSITWTLLTGECWMCWLSSKSNLYPLNTLKAETVTRRKCRGLCEGSYATFIEKCRALNGMF